MDDPARGFYDDLAPDYHLIFADWDAGMARQGAALDRLIGATHGTGRREILDCACGIGTQAIALAALGHHVVGSDLSPVAARRAAAEAARRGLRLPTVAADMRRLPFPAARFGVVVCADNAIAHPLTPANLRAALTEMRRVLRPDGLLILSVRADVARDTHPTVTPVQLNRTPAGQVITFQLWDWHEDGAHYDMRHIQLHPDGDSYTVRVRTALSWAPTSAEVTDSLVAAGFGPVAWHAPKDSGFFQPIVTARPGART